MTTQSDPPSANDDPRTRELVAAAHADSERFLALYEHVSPALWAWCQLRVPRPLRAALDATDVMQETWLRATQSFATYRPERGSFRGWIFGIAKHVLLEGIRGRQRDRAQEGLGPSTRDFVLNQCPESITGISTRLARDEVLVAFLERVSAMSLEDRRILVSCGLELRTAAETAQLLGLTEAGVSKRWLRLRAELRERGWAERLLLSDST